MIGSLTPVANQVMQTLNQRLTEMQVTIARVNDLLNDKNRQNIGNSLGNLNGMLAEDRSEDLRKFNKRASGECQACTLARRP